MITPTSITIITNKAAILIIIHIYINILNRINHKITNLWINSTPYRSIIIIIPYLQRMLKESDLHISKIVNIILIMDKLKNEG